ncbi:hypothetical protein VOLCADRAFT_108363 [Volvox carteri f. nagariensis]|uniref:Uncharacterized protein n=1 Tax=Volvox carteri f. nagariensis TaxID=3068 RepID=D8UJP7_VOLCA|nr:uncharacterized protein VOLCADRAFT_108363 [Volvox carteri f. nagariensis]EFJ40073.1 hypothetical protein VOLCADRAFT_108363 [Volvox carteri f. nagariensis]|eukprot:XP_002958885.1 hypothetical protein VOLCADRAFT_108363 [Volvox carteri f. nagariensis]
MYEVTCERPGVGLIRQILLDADGGGGAGGAIRECMPNDQTSPHLGHVHYRYYDPSPPPLLNIASSPTTTTIPHCASFRLPQLRCARKGALPPSVLEMGRAVRNVRKMKVLRIKSGRRLMQKKETITRPFGPCRHTASHRR